jgi:hypothetical protein
MERQEASDVAIVDSLVTRRSLLKRTGLGACCREPVSAAAR